MNQFNFKIIALIISFILHSPYFMLEAQEHKHSSHSKNEDTTNADKDTEKEHWTCSMHPQINQDKPGKCPICGMDLIKVDSEEDEDSNNDNNSLKLSSKAIKLAEIETTKVKREKAEHEVRLFGKIDYDETRVKDITAWVPGRVDRLYVDYTGISVNKGDHMLYLYSPELLSAQQELIQAKKSLSRMNSDNTSIVASSTRRMLESARQKLLLLGITKEQVSRIEKTQKIDGNMTIYAPMGGVVVEKYINKGDYVDTGSNIYKIADLSHLWVHLDAYESDLPWIRYGQNVSFTSKAFPGEKFDGIVSFIKPFTDNETQTVKVRVNLDNKDGKLKPGLFVSAVIKADISADGSVKAPSFSDKYICPMHPEIVEEHKGTCSICGMDLVESESLSFVNDVHQDSYQYPLIIPASAPLITGKRAVVFVYKEGTGRYESREINLGPRAGKYYVVFDGLKEGEEVVTKGAFKIDADLQIRGKASMMNPEGGDEHSGHSH